MKQELNSNRGSHYVNHAQQIAIGKTIQPYGKVIKYYAMTWFLSALDALPRNAGSKASRVHKRPKEDGGISLKVSTKLGL